MLIFTGTMSMLYFKIIKLYLMLYAYYRTNIDTALMPIEPTKVIYSEMRNSIYTGSRPSNVYLLMCSVIFGYNLR